MAWEIRQGDWLEVLKQMPDESVHCVVTSPPYWGLRDYQTGTWHGGDPSCDHRSPTMRNGRNEDRPKLAGSAATNQAQLILAAHSSCGKCGAVRIDKQLGLERTPQDYIAKMVEGFREVRRVLRKDGTAWVNMGDSYNAQPGQRKVTDTAGPKQSSNNGSITAPSRSVEALKPKDLCGMPWMLAFALREDGWWLRQDIIWSKPNPMPESVTDRCTKAHEYIFLLTKSPRYYFDPEAIKEMALGGHEMGLLRSVVKEPSKHIAWHAPSILNRQASGIDSRTAGTGFRNKRSVWDVTPEPFPEAHFATYPTELVRPCIMAGTSERGCCSKCGAPWKRITEKYDTGQRQKMGDSWDTGPGAHASHHRNGRENGKAGQPIMAERTIGWQSGCRCGAGEPVPCTVLDPFCGAGTTGVVATRLGRNFVGIELNPAYVKMAEDRILNDAPLFNSQAEEAQGSDQDAEQLAFGEE